MLRMQRLTDLLYGAEPARRLRVRQAGLALVLLAPWLAGVFYFVAVGQAARAPVLAWAVLTAAGMVGFFLLIRCGWSRRFADPTLTTAQMLFALCSGAVAYALLGPGRGAVFPAMMVVLMFGMFIVSPQQMRWIGAGAVLLFGATMALMATLQPAVYAWPVELGHFLAVATMMPAVSVLAARLCRMRQRSRQQRTDLARALSQLREHATRCELTGLLNRRHMEAVMAQEHQRCVRSGQTFCLALLDIDAFKRVNEAHGYAVGDAVMRALAQEALRHVRVSDTLSRWDSDAFVVMLSDTRAALARAGLERLCQKVAALRILHGSEAVGVTLSAGLAEHLAGETAAQTLARAEHALQDARALGAGQVAVAA